MKKVLLFGLFLLLIGAESLNAQRKFYTQAFDKGMVILDAHTSFLRIKSRETDAFTESQPVFFNAELGVRTDVGIGLLGGWSQRQVKVAGSTSVAINNYYYGLKLNMHLTRWINEQTKLRIDDRKYDMYLSVWAGRNTEEEIDPLLGGGNFGGTTTIYGGLAGLKIYSKYNVGFMAEAGLGAYGLLNAGICYKF
jgi:hypothetical protein